MSEYAIISRLFLSLNNPKFALSRQGFLGLSHRCCVALHRHKSDLQFETEFEVTLMLRNGGNFLLISKVTSRESNYIHVETPEHLSSSSLYASTLLSCWAVRFTCSLRISSLADHLQGPTSRRLLIKKSKHTTTSNRQPQNPSITFSLHLNHSKASHCLSHSIASRTSISFPTATGAMLTTPAGLPQGGNLPSQQCLDKWAELSVQLSPFNSVVTIDERDFQSWSRVDQQFVLNGYA